jgi:protocatechuate 3,4-dioxygenase beta subunit
MRGKWIILFCLGLLFLSTNRSIAQEPNKVTCTGKVIDAQGQPVTGAKVFLYENVYDERYSSSDFRLASEMTTEADGVFSFSETFDSERTSFGYIITKKEGLAMGWAGCSFRQEQAGDLEIKLTQAEELGGVVVDANDKPVEQAHVSIYMISFTGGGQRQYLSGRLAQMLFTENTDAAGKFTFADLPVEAKADFLVKKQGYATICTYTDSRNLTYSIGRDNIRLVQPVESKIEGIVVEKGTEKPVADVKLMITQDMRRSVSGQEQFRSKDDGTFSVQALPPGSYYLQLIPQRETLADWVANPQEVTTLTGQTNSGVKVELCKGGILEVLVTEAQNNQPVENANVTVREQASDRSFSADSGKDGIARLRLMPGEYQLAGVYIRGSMSARRSRSPMTMEPVIIEDGMTKRIQHQVTGQPKISGVVRDDKGNALKDVKLFVWPMGFQMASSDTEGKYEVSWDPESLPGGPNRGSYLIGRDEKKNLAAAEEINLETKTLDIVLQPGVIITGKVVDPNNKPLEGAQTSVMLFAFNMGTTMGPDSVQTDTDGNFEIRAVPPEQRYMLYTRAEGYGVKNQDININAAVNNRLDVGTIILPLANLTVTGVVVDVNDKPVPNVRIFSSGDNQPNQNTQTDAEGRFEIKACEGRIRINANSSGPTRLYGNIETEGGASNVEIVVSERGSSGGYVPKQPPSLVGKSLPELRDFGIESLLDTNGKIVLVCFFDYEQRPSRNCILQLSKRVQELVAKDLIIVTIQASKIDKATLNEWIKEQSFSFPVGMIEGDSEKVSFAWGVKSLPWLILTDKKQAVRAEGFSITELDRKIGELENVEQ